MLNDEELTGLIIKAFYTVYNTLGYGFLEKVYENALAVELGRLGLAAECQRPIAVYYGGELVGEYFADIVVNGKVILELKAAEALHPAHEAQLVNYLRATDIETGFLFNFGREAKFARKYFSNERKRR